MPGNLYGVSQPGFTPVPFANGGDQSCGAGAETNIFSQTITAPGQGNWYIVMWGVVAILLGATPPGTITIGGRIGSAADFDSYSVATAPLLANATLQIPFLLCSTANQANFFPTGSAFNVTLNPSAQAVTFKNTGSRTLYQLFRGPDA